MHSTHVKTFIYMYINTTNTTYMISFITGITGQDGSYLAELLIGKGYTVYGMIRRQSAIHTPRIDHIYNHVHLKYGDLTDSSSLIGILSHIKTSHPDMERLEVYNLGAQSHVKGPSNFPNTPRKLPALARSSY